MRGLKAVVVFDRQVIARLLKDGGEKSVAGRYFISRILHPVYDQSVCPRKCNSSYLSKLFLRTMSPVMEREEPKILTRETFPCRITPGTRFAAHLWDRSRGHSHRSRYYQSRPHHYDAKEAQEELLPLASCL